jgi:hypothetical protein
VDFTKRGFTRISRVYETRIVADYTGFTERGFSRISRFYGTADWRGFTTFFRTRIDAGLRGVFTKRGFTRITPAFHETRIVADYTGFTERGFSRISTIDADSRRFARIMLLNRTGRPSGLPGSSGSSRVPVSEIRGDPRSVKPENPRRSAPREVIFEIRVDLRPVSRDPRRSAFRQTGESATIRVDPRSVKPKSA